MRTPVIVVKKEKRWFWSLPEYPGLENGDAGAFDRDTAIHLAVCALRQHLQVKTAPMHTDFTVNSRDEVAYLQVHVSVVS